MQITPRLRTEDFDKELRKNIDSRRTELQPLKGIRKLVRRIRIEFWAWAKTIREGKHLEGGGGVE